MNWTIATYVAYLLVSVGLTGWVGRTLYRSGELFLEDVFDGRENLAHAVNHLLVVGFYLVNFGFVSLFLKLGDVVLGPQEAIEALSRKIGVVLLVLGALHFGNLFVLNRLRRRARLEDSPEPPVAPTGRLGFAPPGFAPPGFPPPGFPPQGFLPPGFPQGVPQPGSGPTYGPPAAPAR